MVVLDLDNSRTRAYVVAAGGGSLDVFSSHLSFLSLFVGGGVRWCWVKFHYRGVLQIWIRVGQGPTALATGTGGGVWTFLFSSIISHFFLRLSWMARCRLKYCLKGPLNPKQPTNQPIKGPLTPNNQPTNQPSLWETARYRRGWSGGAKVLGKLSVPGRPTSWKIVGQGPIALAVGAGGGCLDIFSLVYLFSFLSPSLWETARYRLKYCLKGPLNPKQPTNQPDIDLNTVSKGL